MKNILIFICGCIVGVVATILVLFVLSIGIRQNESKIQHIEIRGKQGDVILHTGMTKDSVKILVGKPDEINLRSIGSITYEQWGYKIRNQYVSDLDIDFKDGRLESVRQE